MGKLNTDTGKYNIDTGKYNTDIDITHTQVKITQTQVDRHRQETERNLLHIYASCDLRTSTCNNYINLFGTTYHKRVKSF